MLGLLLAATGVFHAPTTFKQVDPGQALLIHAERVIVKPGVELAPADVLVQDGLIVAVGTGLALPEGGREITGKVLCAGFLDAWSSLGLDPASATDEGTSPSTRSADALDPFTAPHHLEHALRAGVTSVRVQAGATALTGGYGSILRLDPALEHGDSLVLDDANQSATIGTARGGRDRDIFDRVGEVERVVGLIEGGRKYNEDLAEYNHELEEWQKTIAEKEKELEKDAKKKKKDREKAVKEAEEKDKEFKEEKYKEDKRPRAPKLDPDVEAMARVAEGLVPLVVEAHRHEEIRSLLERTAPFDRLRIVLAGATESRDHAKLLAKRSIPVLLWPKPSEPWGDEWDGHDIALASELAEEGVGVIFGSGGSDTSRELRLLAAMAVSRGLDRDVALNAITLAPAQAFDVADRIGSIERGKDADLIVLDGDPLDTTARIHLVLSKGRVVVEQ